MMFRSACTTNFLWVFSSIRFHIDAFGVLLMLSNSETKLSSSRRARKRSDIDVIASILKEAHEGARKTRIMYKCNLSHRQLKVYLKLLLGMKLLELTEEGSKLDVLKTTAKGLKFLDAYRTLKALMT